MLGINFESLGISVVRWRTLREGLRQRKMRFPRMAHMGAWWRTTREGIRQRKMRFSRMTHKDTRWRTWKIHSSGVPVKGA